MSKVAELTPRLWAAEGMLKTCKSNFKILASLDLVLTNGVLSNP